MDVIDRLFRSLAHPYRRELLLELVRRDGEQRLPVAEAVTDPTVNRTSFEIEMCHNHLPRLDECGLVEWHRDAGEVSKGPLFDDIEPLLESIRDELDPTVTEEI